MVRIVVFGRLAVDNAPYGLIVLGGGADGTVPDGTAAIPVGDADGTASCVTVGVFVTVGAAGVAVTPVLGVGLCCGCCWLLSACSMACALALTLPL
ncbi:MAG: hypothetical protein K0R52_1617, partial [Alphaproteobacteria bacterium]|nr:hypothetical protein [Alphaproteobacteria bacterium]